MSHVLNTAGKIVRKYSGIGMISRALTPSSPDVPPQPQPPTIDAAATQSRDELDRLRRRKGVLANIFGGSSMSAAPQVGTKTLLGG